MSRVKPPLPRTTKDGKPVIDKREKEKVRSNVRRPEFRG